MKTVVLKFLYSSFIHRVIKVLYIHVNLISRMLDGCARCRTADCDCQTMEVKYSDPKDDSLTPAMKKVLYDFCIK